MSRRQLTIMTKIISVLCYVVVLEYYPETSAARINRGDFSLSFM